MKVNLFDSKFDLDKLLRGKDTCQEKRTKTDMY